MHMTAKISGPKLSTLVGFPGPEDWNHIGNGLRLRIINRTRSRNVDADLRPFEPYSPGYAAAKAKRGGLVGGGRVNLTGVRAGARMLDNIVFRSNATANPRVVLSFGLAEKATIASYHMGEGRVDRTFFALSEDDMDWIVKYLKDRLAGRKNSLLA